MRKTDEPRPGVVRRLWSWANRHRPLVAALLVVGLALGVAGVVWFEPHKLFVDDRVDEAIPTAPAAERTPATASPSPAPEGGPEELSRGTFRPLEHDVEGEALVLGTANGERYVRFEDLNVSNGPDLFVYLSVLGPDQGWHDADDAEFLDLGELKGNIGDQNYLLPGGRDLSGFRTVVIWCRRFSVGFAVAPISIPG